MKLQILDGKCRATGVEARIGQMLACHVRNYGRVSKREQLMAVWGRDSRTRFRVELRWNHVGGVGEYLGT